MKSGSKFNTKIGVFDRSVRQQKFYWCWQGGDTDSDYAECYLGDMLDADGGCDSPVRAIKMHEYLPILTEKGFSLKPKGKVYAPCV